ncbi:MAG TPA: CapA family protein [Polyangiaceae bacterium]|nr:CapA family protein [Polyangiaceae bacterium]
MRYASTLFGFWLAACASAAPQKTPHASVAIAAAVPVIEMPPAPLPSYVRVLVGGDLLPHRPQLLSPESIGASLVPLSPLFRSADAVVANYETATGEISGIDPSTLSLAATPAWMKAVRGDDVTAITLANNHACDLGGSGLSASIQTAGELGFAAMGAAREEPFAARTLAERDGHRVCGVAWTTFVNDHRPGCETTGRVAMAKPSREGRLRVAKAVADAIQGGCDAVIAIFHGGEEYAPQTRGMLAMARAAAEAGADAVVIHHPHVVSPLEVMTTEDGRHVPVFASVGNLVSNQGESWTPALPATQADRRIVYLNGWTRLGMLADLELRLDPQAGRQRVVAWGYHLVFTDNDHVLDKSNPHPRIEARVLDRDEDRAVVDKLARDAGGPRAVFDDPCWIERDGADATAGPSCRP